MPEEKWCPCGEFPEEMCDQWPACVDINGIQWGTLEAYQKYRRKKESKTETPVK